jgi:hypothetical protein
MQRVGTVANVDIADDGRVYVDVIMSPSNAQTDVQFKMPAPNIWAVPVEGDVVELTEQADNSLLARSPQNAPGAAPPNGLDEGDIAIRLNEDTVLAFSRNSDESVDLTITCDGDLQLDAENILVGEQGNAQPVATADHTHDFEYDGAGDNSSTKTGTTDPTDSSGTTEADIE